MSVGGFSRYTEDNKVIPPSSHVCLILHSTKFFYSGHQHWTQLISSVLENCASYLMWISGSIWQFHIFLSKNLSPDCSHFHRRRVSQESKNYYPESEGGGSVFNISVLHAENRKEAGSSRVKVYEGTCLNNLDMPAFSTQSGNFPICIFRGYCDLNGEASCWKQMDI